MHGEKVSALHLKEAGRKLERDESVPDSVIRNYISGVFESFYAAHAVTESEENMLRSSIAEGMKQEQPRDTLSNLLNGAFAELEGLIRIKDEREKKWSILDGILEEYNGKIEMKRTRHAFWIQDTRR